jgi:hypothetical protein
VYILRCGEGTYCPVIGLFSISFAVTGPFTLEGFLLNRFTAAECNEREFQMKQMLAELPTAFKKRK